MSNTRDLFTLNFPDPKQIAEDINSHGYKIYDNAIDLLALAEMKTFWSNYFNKARPSHKVARGNIRLGEENFHGYSNNQEHCLHRDLDFLWNKPTHELTRRLGEEIHRVRNLAQGFEQNVGFSYREDCYGIYISTSCYPIGQGRMSPHMDGHNSTPILQYMVNITHKGMDYKKGGLFLINDSGKKIDVDAMMAPGSIVFFDGRLIHGVDTIEHPIGNSPGRIGSFAITTYFRTRKNLPYLLRRLEDKYWTIENRLGRLFRKSVKDGY